ncbi:hypothetical protein ACHAWX_007766 [Stephanocyclus meneghinianus]
MRPKPDDNGMLRSRIRGTPAESIRTEQEQNPLLLRNDSDDGPSNIDVFDSPIADKNTRSQSSSADGYRVYPQRWLMLFYLSILNLLSDWAGLSVAPIATLTVSAYSDDIHEHEHDNDDIKSNSQNNDSFIQPEALVTVFLIASSIGTAFEPWILRRLGLRRTVVLGAFANMLGSLVKSGGFTPLPFLSLPSMTQGLHGSYALYLGFFFVGFAQPLFQCTPALLSASWFPEHERTLATSIALNANQLGVGCAFIVGALWVRHPNQIAAYFTLLSFFSVAAFLGCALQLEDAPPTPPSGSSRIMRGTLEVSVRDLIQRASSTLLVGTDYDITHTFLNMPFVSRGEDGDAAAGTRSASNAMEASAKTLLRQHVHSSPNNKYRPWLSSARQPLSSARQPLSPSIFATSYTDDEYSYCDEGAEPIVTQTPHHLEIDIRDDQIFLAAKACFARKGFAHALVVFTVAGVIINTLSTYLDYLVRLSYYDDNDGGSVHDFSAGAFVACIGGIFQVVIMISSIVVGSVTDKTRSYFIVTLTLLASGAFALAECGVSLDEDRGRALRISLVVVSAFLGPLMPVAAELGVEIAHPLSENTVLVILQLSCNLSSALFIPVFQAIRDVGVTERTGDGNFSDDGAAMVLGSGRPPYTFSFYLMILLCALSTVFFATFDGKYLRLQSEMAKKSAKDTNQQLFV